MQFCPTHGLLLVKKRTRSVCPKCGKSQKGNAKIKTVEKMAERTKVGLIKEKETSVWPVTTAVCRKCHNTKAYFWSAQMRATDEAETRFFRCTKCKNTWREYA